MAWQANENAPIDITDFQGEVGAVHHGDTPEGAAYTAVNVRFENGRVEPRYPFESSPSFATKLDYDGPDPGGIFPRSPDAIRTIAFGQTGFFLYAHEVTTPSSVFILRIRTDVYDATLLGDIGNPRPVGIWTIQFGSLLACGSYSESPLQTSSRARLVQLDSGSAEYVFDTSGLRGWQYSEPLLPWLKTDLTPSTLKSGTSGMDLGVHAWGVMFRTRLGTYTNVFTDPSWTVTITGTGETVAFTITPTSAWPREYAEAILVLTPAGSLSSYYVMLDQGGPLEVAVPTETTTAITFTGIDVSDADLQLKPTIEAYNNVLRDETASTGPYQIAYGVPFGNRAVYILKNNTGTETIAVASDYGSPSAVDILTRRIPIPGELTLYGAFELNDIIWFSTSRGLYGFVDNGRNASEWGDPTIVGNYPVAHSPSAMAVDRSRHIAFVGGRHGLRLFDGQRISAQPITRINEASTPQQRDDVWHQWIAIACLSSANELYALDEESDGNSELYCIKYENLDNLKVSRIRVVDPADDVTVLPIRAVTVGPVYGWQSITAPWVEQLIISYDVSGLSGDRSSIAWMPPRIMMGLTAGYAGDWIAVTSSPDPTRRDYPVDYEFYAIPGVTAEGDRNSVGEYSYVLARMTVQNPAIFNRTVNFEMVRRKGNVRVAKALTPYLPTVVNEFALDIERKFHIPARRIGFRFYGSLRYGCFSLSRLQLFVQRRFA